MPFDYRNLIGYFIVYAFGSLSVFYILELSAAVVTFIIGSCLLLTSFTKDIKQMIVALSKYESNSMEVRQKLTEIVQFHVNAKK